MAYRVERVNNLIRQEISELLRHQAKDPRLDSLISVTDVSTSPDLRHAKVFISRIGSEEEKQETLEVLVAASGFFRTELAKRLRLRHIPELSFHRDDSIEQGDHILQLIDEVSSDSSTGKQRA